MAKQPHPARPLDAPARSWTDRLPAALQPFAQLSRLDRPVGWPLLTLPCLIGMVPYGAALGFGWQGAWHAELGLAALFALGALAMRGAGCTYNDILDRKLDAQVARTAGRPLPSRRVSVRAAGAWLALQLGLGLFVLLQLPQAGQIVALAALPLVALYPLMKRITWWPQVWLGLTFSWGVLVADACLEPSLAPTAGVEPLAFGITPAGLALYLGCVAWTIAYDTLYALQDREDDALIGVRSTARLFADRWRPWTLGFYAGALFLWGAGARLCGAGWTTVAALGLIGAVVIWPLVERADPAQPETALAAFKANVGVGFLVLAALMILPAWWTAGGYGLGWGPPP